MTAGSWPKATPFDPVTGAEAEVLSLLFGGPDAELAGVLLLAAPGSRRDAWAARVAVALARAWSERSGTVVLADACLESPEIHGLLAEQNGEGVADVFQFGASARRVRRTIEGERFEFIPAGVYVPDPPGVLRHGAWSRLLEDTLAAGRHLMVLAPATAEGVDVLANRIGAVVLLAGSEEDLATEAPDADLRAVLAAPTLVSRAVVTPGEGTERAEADALTPRRPDAEFQRLRLPQGEAREAHIAEARLRQRSEVLGRKRDDDAPPAVRVPPPPLTERMPQRTAEDELDEPGFVGAEAAGRRYPAPVVWTVVLIALLSLLAGAWHFIGRAWWTARAVTPAVSAPVDSVIPTPEPPGPVGPMPVAIALEAHTDLPTALERVRALDVLEPDLAFLISPTLVDGVLYYRVMAGPVADSAVADSILDRLVASGTRGARMGSEIQNLPLAFLIGEFDTLAAASARRDELEQLDLPGYVVRLAYPDGERYRLYAGAYAGPADADVMRELLRSAGVPDSLVTRVGSSST